MHSSTGRYAKDLMKLENNFGIAALGFYWKAVELMMISCKKIPIICFQQLRYKPLRFFDVFDIIYLSGLFDIDEEFCVTLAKGKDNGIEKKALDNYFDCLLAETHAEARAKARAEVRADDGVRPGPLDMDKEKMRVEREAQIQFNRFMHRCCSHLCEMEEPLTIEQYRELKQKYTWQQIENVLVSMENEVDLYRKKRSCYQTALSWLMARSKQRLHHEQ